MAKRWVQVSFLQSQNKQLLIGVLVVSGWSYPVNTFTKDIMQTLMFDGSDYRPQEVLLANHEVASSSIIREIHTSDDTEQFFLCDSFFQDPLASSEPFSNVMALVACQLQFR